MNRTENLERELTVWFADTAMPRAPDFTDDILRLTAATRQRTRWSFPERWLPMSAFRQVGAPSATGCGGLRWAK